MYNIPVAETDNIHGFNQSFQDLINANSTNPCMICGIFGKTNK